MVSVIRWQSQPENYQIQRDNADRKNIVGKL
jgi:hypothetical protein